MKNFLKVARNKKEEYRGHTDKRTYTTNSRLCIKYPPYKKIRETSKIL